MRGADGQDWGRSGEVQGGVSFALARTTLKAKPVGRAKGGQKRRSHHRGAYPPPASGRSRVYNCTYGRVPCVQLTAHKREIVPL